MGSAGRPFESRTDLICCEATASARWRAAKRRGGSMRCDAMRKAPQRAAQRTRIAHLIPQSLLLSCCC